MSSFAFLFVFFYLSISFFYLQFLFAVFNSIQGNRGGLGQGEQLRPDPDLLLQAGLDQELVFICLIFFLPDLFFLPHFLFLLDQGHESSRCAALGSCRGRTFTDKGGFLNTINSAGRFTSLIKLKLEIIYLQYNTGSR